MASLIERRKMMQIVTGGGWLSPSAKATITTAFGSPDGRLVIQATEDYLDSLAYGTAVTVAGYINNDPMLVCSLGLQPTGVVMPVRFAVGAGGFSLAATEYAASIQLSVFKIELDAEVLSCSTAWRNILALHGLNSSLQLSTYWQIQSTSTTQLRLMIESTVLQTNYNIPLYAKKTYGYQRTSDGTRTAWIDSDIVSSSGTMSASTYAIIVMQAGFDGRIYEIRFDYDNTYKLVPSMQNGAIKMIDLNGGSFELVQITGASYDFGYLRNGQPWTPGT